MNGPPTRYSLSIAIASARSSGVKSITSASGSPSGSEGSGRVGIGCVAAVQLPGTTVCTTGTSSIGQIGSPVSRLNAKMMPVLVV